MAAPGAAGVITDDPYPLSRSNPDSATTIDAMTAARDELRRLVEELADEQVPTALAEVRRLAEEPAEVEWPPPWFGSITTGRSDTSMRVDEILAEGFGR